MRESMRKEKELTVDPRCSTITDMPIAIHFLSQAELYGEEGNIVELYSPPDRTCSLRIMDREKAALASFSSTDFATSFSGYEDKSNYQQFSLHTVTQFSPSPVISGIENVSQDAHISLIEVGNPEDGHSKSYKEASSSNTLQDVHIKRGTLYVTTLIIPKQESTSSTCLAINDEEIFAIQNERSLIPVGWIHTHPSQSCFLSSVDLHTQYSYQVMVPEAFAIVMAPTDTSRSNGIFRLSDPGGMSVLRECQEQGFHSHKETANGSPIYEHCSNVYKNSNLRFEIFDLR
ncbi:AMSH-like ubiquitin thioesterase 2 isoform X3 [Ziziphus jujuba]|uniref:AMSH-like ubiquitin thioesterase 2 isoform X3 n=1 Tax=Ziziphus jujuba TaxID=326968 RepID=A0ABM3I829_ZIZJJ|nr:AMSH-like ubiquitin thioesterase 2 isoform X3 [Ziziphus jujuba]